MLYSSLKTKRTKNTLTSLGMRTRETPMLLVGSAPSQHSHSFMGKDFSFNNYTEFLTFEGDVWLL